MNKKRKKTIRKGKNGKAAILLWGRALFGIVLMFAGLMLYVWKQIRVDQLARDVNTLKRAIEQVVNDNKAVEVDIASLSGLNRIEKVAIEELGMQYPDKFPIVLKLKVPDPDSGAWRTAALCRFGDIVSGARDILLPSMEAESFNGD